MVVADLGLDVPVVDTASEIPAQEYFMRLVDETVSASVGHVRTFVHALVATRLAQARSAIKDYGQRYAEAMLGALDTHKQGGAAAAAPRVLDHMWTVSWPVRLHHHTALMKVRGLSCSSPGRRLLCTLLNCGSRRCCMRLRHTSRERLLLLPHSVRKAAHERCLAYMGAYYLIVAHVDQSVQHLDHPELWILKRSYLHHEQESIRMCRTK